MHRYLGVGHCLTEGQKLSVQVLSFPAEPVQLLCRVVVAASCEVNGKVSGKVTGEANGDMNVLAHRREQCTLSLSYLLLGLDHVEPSEMKLTLLLELVDAEAVVRDKVIDGSVASGGGGQLGHFCEAARGCEGGGLARFDELENVQGLLY